MIEFKSQACEGCGQAASWDFAASIANSAFAKANNLSEQLIVGLDSFDTQASAERGFGPDAREVATDITATFAAETSAAASGVEAALDLVRYIDCDKAKQEEPQLECPRLSAFLLLLTSHLAEVRQATGDLTARGDEFTTRFDSRAADKE